MHNAASTGSLMAVSRPFQLDHTWRLMANDLEGEAEGKEERRRKRLHIDSDRLSQYFKRIIDQTKTDARS